jgi:hypothetical protein
LLNEIIWVYHGPSPVRKTFNRKHDTILVYTKSSDYIFIVDAVRQPYDPSTVKTFASSPKAGFGKVPNLERGKVPEDWWYFPVVARLHNERTGYPTQKPQALLERILLASSRPGDLVADFFCGSGTAALAARRLGRRFIASDVAWRAVHTTRARLGGATKEPFNVLKVPALPAAKQAREDFKVEGVHRLNPATFQPVGSNLANRQIRQEAGNLQPATVSIDLNSVPELDYWEVDPAWDGQVFRSAAQAVRPRRKGTIPTVLELPAHPTGKPVCARLVSAAGEQFQVTL